MATINVCDWPGCGAAVERHGDRLALEFESVAMRTIVEQMERGEMKHVEADPESIRKDLCRKHSEHLRAALVLIFDGEAKTVVIETYERPSGPTGF